MRKTLVLLSAAALAVVGLADASVAAPARVKADGIPVIDASAACHGASDIVQGKGSDRAEAKATVKSCMDSEARIRKELADNWSRYTPSSRSQCSSEMAHAYHASYVELISCLEMANPTAMRSRSVN